MGWFGYFFVYLQSELNSNILNLKNLFIAAVCVAAGHVGTAGAEVWHLVAEGVGKIPVSAIEYMISHPSEGTMDVILNDNATVYAGVGHATFEYGEEAGSSAPSEPRECIVGPFDDYITVSGLADGAVIRLYSSQGMLMAEFTAPGHGRPLGIDVSGYAAGIYILRTEHSSVKFIKR